MTRRKAIPDSVEARVGFENEPRANYQVHRVGNRDTKQTSEYPASEKGRLVPGERGLLLKCDHGQGIVENANDDCERQAPDCKSFYDVRRTAC